MCLETYMYVHCIYLCPFFCLSDQYWGTASTVVWCHSLLTTLASLSPRWGSLAFKYQSNGDGLRFTPPTNTLPSPNNRLLHSVGIVPWISNVHNSIQTYCLPRSSPLPSIPTQASFCPPSCLHSLHLALIDKIFVLIFSTSSSPSLRNSTFDLLSSGNVLPLLFYLKCPLFRKVSLLNTLKWPSALSSSLHLILWCITHILPLISPLE